MKMKRLDDLIRFYSILDSLTQRQGGMRKLSAPDAGKGIPQRGVYFFFEETEHRAESGDGPRVVRVGTHALKEGSKSTLWKRLSQHRGALHSGGGNHRGSIFRRHTGQAMIIRDRLDIPTWGCESDIRQASLKSEVPLEGVKQAELPLEIHVSRFIRGMDFIFINIPDVPGPESMRGFIERNAVALTSNFQKDAIDSPSDSWLGNHCDREKVRLSGLWNSNHVTETYDAGFLDELERFTLLTQ